MSQLEVDKIIPQSGTTLTIGETGDTITIPSGATQSITGTLSGAGAIDLSSATITLNDIMKNTPAFQAYLSSDQSISNNVTTKVQFDTEVFDTDGCYDNATNYRFTPTVAGKYFVYAQIRPDTGGSSQAEYVAAYIEKNGSRVAGSVVDFRGNNGRQAGLSLSTVVEMNGSTDYVEGYALASDTSGNPAVESSDLSTYFGAYRLIGV